MILQRGSCVAKIAEAPCYHIDQRDWRETAAGAPRGYIQAETLSELWFHTGTACNLACPFCLEGSKPGDHRLEQLRYNDIVPYLLEAVELGVEQFSFTGGEPFVNKDLPRILAAALEYRPCMVLTNATKPLARRFNELPALLEKPHPLRFRVSLDYPEPVRHDAARGPGSFQLALETMGRLHQAGFRVSIARLGERGECAAAVNEAYGKWFASAGLPPDTHIVVFPDFHGPGEHPAGVPEITENCMTTYHSAESRSRFMCSFSKMVVKRAGHLRVCACTLVDDDTDYDLGTTLREAMRPRVMLRHHRCFSCFSCGASCSER